MAGVPGPNSRHPQSPPPPPPAPYGPLRVRTWPFSHWIGCLVARESFLKITSQRLLDQSQGGVYMGHATYPPILGFFGPIREPYPKGLNCLFNPL